MLFKFPDKYVKSFTVGAHNMRPYVIHITFLKHAIKQLSLKHVEKAIFIDKFWLLYKILKLIVI